MKIKTKINKWDLTELKKLNTDLTFDSAIPALSIYPREIKTQLNTKACTWIFVSAIFILAQSGNKYLSADEWTNMVYPYSEILLSHKKENGWYLLQHDEL